MLYGIFNSFYGFISQYLHNTAEVGGDYPARNGKTDNGTYFTGVAAETKEYKANKEAYKGSAGDLSTLVRIAVTGRRNTPDLCSIMQVLGKEECVKRLSSAISNI